MPAKVRAWRKKHAQPSIEPIVALMRAGIDITIPVEEQSSSVLNCILDLVKTNEQEKYRVLVVGSGPSGMATAVRLSERGRKVEVRRSGDARAGHQQQRVHVRTLSARRCDHGLIYRLLAGELNLANHPPDSGMKPQHRADQFFHNREEPVASRHMQQFMAEDRFLHFVRQRRKVSGQQDDGIAPSKGDGTFYFVGYE